MQNKKNIPYEIIYGAHPILELLKAKSRKIYTLYTTNPTPEIFVQIKSLLLAHIQIQYVERDVLTKMAETSEHQGIVARVQPFQFRKKMFTPEKEPCILLLDSIHDPRNLGAIIRSAVCTGVNGILLPTRHTVPVSATVHKAAAGLTERIQIIQVPTTTSGIEMAKEAGYEIYLATIEGASVTTTSIKKPLCLVIGNEGEGIGRVHYKQGTHISLPQSASDISYNASVAAGIFMFLIMEKKVHEV